MGRGWNGSGSTRRWRRVRAYVLARDGYVCRMVEGCQTRADSVDHVVPLVLGGARYDPANLRAACTAHNAGAGAVLSSRPVLGAPSREWS